MEWDHKRGFSIAQETGDTILSIRYTDMNQWVWSAQNKHYRILKIEHHFETEEAAEQAAEAWYKAQLRN